MTSAAIGIICKTPKPGASKTRLAPLLSAAGAAELAGCFLADVAAVIDAVPPSTGRQGYAVYAPEGSEAQLRALLPDDFRLLCRFDASLGHVLLGATRHLLERGHDCVILINGDSPTLPSALIACALTALRANGDRLVLGPAHDGGYCLIGLKQAHAGIFENIPWSTSAVLAATMAQAATQGLDVVQLPMWYDIDDEETLRMLVGEIRGRALPFDHGTLVGGDAPATRHFLAQRPWLFAERHSDGAGR